MFHNDAISAAFPTIEHTDSGYPCVGEPGLTVREWYAGMALQGILSRGPDAEAARLAFQYADAMLAEAAK